MRQPNHMWVDMKPLMFSLSIYYTMFARNKLAQKPLLQQKISVGDKIKRPLQTVLSRPYGQGCPYWPNQPLRRLAASGPSRGRSVWTSGNQIGAPGVPGAAGNRETAMEQTDELELIKRVPAGVLNRS